MFVMRVHRSLMSSAILKNLNMLRGNACVIKPKKFPFHSCINAPNSHFCHLKQPEVHQDYDRQVSISICAIGFHRFLGCRTPGLEDCQGLSNEVIRAGVWRHHCNIMCWLLPRLKWQNPCVSQQNFNSCIHSIVTKKPPNQSVPL